MPDPILDTEEPILGGWSPVGYEGLRGEDLNTLLHIGLNFQKQKNESRAAAIRYQGQMDFQRLVSQGVPHNEALLQTAHKMFYQDPGAFASTLQRQEAAAAAERRAAQTAAYQSQTLAETKRKNLEMADIANMRLMLEQEKTLAEMQRKAEPKSATIANKLAAFKLMPPDSPAAAALGEEIAKDVGLPENIPSPTVQKLLDAYKSKWPWQSGKETVKKLSDLGWTPEGTRIGATPPVVATNVPAPVVAAPAPVSEPAPPKQSRFVWDRKTGKLIPKP